ncbi:putative mitochondrial protein AtMg00310 [Apium graveolens]|uniref:putative mitochondrial protein AtMg00310 n=1 Tax=Apium graveolens TaxID=4045 RepID=UPI003D7A583A
MALQSIPTYTMSVFLFPNKVCQDVENMINNFWWKSSKNNKGIHWRSWNKLRRHKNNGGMGFKNIRDFNLAMLGRQGWRLLNFENSVGRVFKAKYYPGSNLLEAKLGCNPSYVWRSSLESWTLVKRGARWRIGDGHRISVLDQPWLSES